MLKNKEIYDIISALKEIGSGMMKKSKINIGIIVAFVIIALFNQCREVNVNRESKVGEAINFNTVDVKLEDILTPPTTAEDKEIVEYYMNEVPKTR